MDERNKCDVCCGLVIDNRYNYCCDECKIIGQRVKNNKRCERWRKNNINLKIGIEDITCDLCGKVERMSFCRQRYCKECIPKARRLQERKDAKKYYQRNKEEIKKRVRDWKRNNPNNAENTTRKHLVRLEANSKIKIPKGELCGDCKKKLAEERHHEDYDKPLEVDFLCTTCHTKRTNEELEDTELKKFIEITGGLNL